MAKCHIRITSAMFPAFTASVRLRDMVVQVASKLVDEVWGEEVGEEWARRWTKRWTSSWSWCCEWLRGGCLATAGKAAISSSGQFV